MDNIGPMIATKGYEGPLIAPKDYVGPLIAPEEYIGPGCFQVLCEYFDSSKWYIGPDSC